MTVPGAGSDDAVERDFVEVRRPRAYPPLGWMTRLSCAAVAAGCLTVLAIAARLDPDARGVGTHEQLGLAPCGWLVQFGWPCMSCGMTTAFSHMAHLRPLSALAAQPMGAVLYLATAVTAVLTAVSVVTGRDWPSLYIYLYEPRVWSGVLLMWMAAWAYKIVAYRLSQPTP
jgi:hypothetical protein